MAVHIPCAHMQMQRNKKNYKIRRNSCDMNYKKLYRFEKDNVVWLTQHFLGVREETRGGALTNEQKMKIFLRYVADPGFQVGVAEDVGVDQSTVSKTFSFVMEKIKEKKQYWIQFPRTEIDLQHARDLWQERYTFPNAIGALDCTHILIKKPLTHADEYINRKGLHSINIQATCNAKEEFTSMDASWPGSVHDSRIWKNSHPHRFLSGQSDILLLGDSGYGIAPWLMVPYKNPVMPEHFSFNRCLKKERVTIERCFGQLKQRFPILQSKVRLATEKIPSVVLCCFILHNVAKYLHDEDFATDIIEPEEELQLPEEGRAADRLRGQRRRDELSRIIHRF